MGIIVILAFLFLPSIVGAEGLPESAPMHAYGFASGNWHMMAHGNVFLKYGNQDVFESGGRGDDGFDAPNWFMLEGNRPLGSIGTITLRGMFSLDPLTVGKEGYPLLFQSGETYKGEPLIDRQHPHDLFGELSVRYGVETENETGLFIYFGLPGQPELGPVTYLHRPSSGANPDAPLGHHWQDASHITFGVASAGIEYGRIGFSGSVFTGREPDEDRYDIEEPRFDSYSLRLSAMPTKDTSIQVSHGFLKSPEILEPDIDIRRTTASVLYSRALAGGSLSTAVVWGQNKPEGAHALNAYLLEASLETEVASPYGRLEFVEKAGEDLGIGGHDDVFNVAALTLGSAFRILSMNKFNLDAGAQGTAYAVDSGLRNVYGDTPFSVEVFVRLRPSSPPSHAMHGM